MITNVLVDRTTIEINYHNTNYEVIVADYAFTDAYSVSWFLYEMGYLVELDKIKFI